jgi:serine/threonine protein kinase
MARWQPVHVLGSGAFGQVYLAWDTTDRRYVAVKHFTGQNELDLLRFVIESRIRVDHPHLVRTVAFRLVDDDAWLVTELARGGSLRPMLTHGPQPVGWVAEVVDQTLDALAALHASGVVHRDIKPANLLLRDPGLTTPYVLVGDFGIAAWRTVSMTGVGAAIGTLGYLAPEYLNGTPPSPRTDLFAVGVLAGELLAGRRLVHHSNSTPDLPSDWDHQIPLPTGVPGHLADVLRRMSDPDPSRRYTDCLEAREALLHAYPRTARQDLTAVEAPDLLASVSTPTPAQTPGPAAATPGPPPTSGPKPTIPPAQSPGAADTSGPALASGPTPDQSFGPVGTSGPTSRSGPASTSGPTPPAQTYGPVGTSNPMPSIPPAQTFGPATTSGPIPSIPAPPHDLTQRVSTPARPMPALPPPPHPKRRFPWAVVTSGVVVAAAVAAGLVLWLGDNHPAGPTPGPTSPPDVPVVAWTPQPVEACSRVDLGRLRQNNTQRCQRTSAEGQSWVAAPVGGFPRSNPAGPFVGEPCGPEATQDFSPAGVPVTCRAGKWAS